MKCQIQFSTRRNGRDAAFQDHWDGDQVYITVGLRMYAFAGQEFAAQIRVPKPV